MTETEPVIALVAAVAENGVIGHQGDMPWRIPSEMKHFRRITMGKPVIMGRKTFASLKKPLDGRDDIVVTRSRTRGPIGAIVVESIEQALKVAHDCALARGADEIMVIGGAEIYSAMLPHAGRLYLTRVHAEPQGDTVMPEIDLSEWTETERSERLKMAGDDHDYTISILSRATNPKARPIPVD